MENFKYRCLSMLLHKIIHNIVYECITTNSFTFIHSQASIRTGILVHLPICGQISLSCLVALAIVYGSGPDWDDIQESIHYQAICQDPSGYLTTCSSWFTIQYITVLYTYSTIQYWTVHLQYNTLLYCTHTVQYITILYTYCTIHYYITILYTYSTLHYNTVSLQYNTVLYSRLTV